MTCQPPTYPRHRFPAEIISHAVWLYHVFGAVAKCVEIRFLRLLRLRCDEDIGSGCQVNALRDELLLTIKVRKPDNQGEKVVALLAS
jgi:hypothetical protein